jgi:hypothetical protein
MFMKKVVRRIRSLFEKPSIEELAAYQHKIPQNIKVIVSYDQKMGYWTAKVVEIEGKKVPGLIITESKTEKGIVGMVNDAVLTYLDFPEYMKSSMPPLLPEDINFDKKITQRSTSLVFAK